MPWAGPLAVVAVVSVVNYDTIPVPASASGEQTRMALMGERLLKLILPVLAAAAGCATHTRPAPGVSTAVEADPGFEALWRAAEDVLQEYRFRIDRKDRRAGVITTHPLLGRHGLEFWRKDATTWREVLEGTLQTIYRSVTVQILPDPNRECR